MTQHKRAILPRGLVVAIVALLIAACGMITANAASDGAVLEGVKESVKKGVQLFLNGEEVDAQDYITNTASYTTEDGQTVTSYTLEVTDEDTAASAEIVIISDDATDPGDVTIEMSGGEMSVELGATEDGTP